MAVRDKISQPCDLVEKLIRGARQPRNTEDTISDENLVVWRVLFELCLGRYSVVALSYWRRLKANGVPSVRTQTDMDNLGGIHFQAHRSIPRLALHVFSRGDISYTRVAPAFHRGRMSLNWQRTPPCHGKLLS
jgi:hypothetical protein